MRAQAAIRRIGSLACAIVSLVGVNALHGEVRDGVPRSEGLAAWSSFPGCAALDGPTRRRFYLDPAQPGTSGDGSPQHPWPGLAEALLQHANTLRGGDTLMLLSGDHGEVRITANSSGWVRILPAPGAKPIVRRVHISGARWLLSGLTFRSDHPGPLVLIDGGAHDIVLENNRFLSAEDAQGWTPQELNERGATGLLSDGRRGTQCLTIRDNSFRFVDYGAKLLADKTVFAGNLIDNFGADAVDYHGSDVTLAHNVITNARESANDEHVDAMQGFQPGGEGWDPKHNANVTIEGNLVIRQTDPKLPFPEYMQGIDNFDGDWDNLKVINNVVITNTWHGMFFQGVHHGLIANNTVLSDEASTVNNPPHAKAPVKMNGQRVWLGFGDLGRSAPSNDVIIRNNIAQSIQITSSRQTVRLDHNFVYHMWFEKPPGAVRPLAVAMSADLGNHNRVVPDLPRHFVVFDPKAFRYDLHLDPRSPAVGAGNSELAPLVDIEGRGRTGLVDVGAFGRGVQRVGVADAP